MWDLIVSVPDHCLSFYCLHFICDKCLTVSEVYPKMVINIQTVVSGKRKSTQKYPN